ncbi:MAG: hypothetical protein KBT87_01740 [Gammaproteobacteria bacterium]|jgi:hypothetical protein|nr:hypothetical protein [Gammaproteobacteria bacterium]MBQ0773373.1 hypothetical protein [Gammaproteobacteria bacterium]|tara:strand:+ start:75482 stop:75877 length:396 start_codon:yes stop_codon:yes gene_type:complete
MRPIIALLTLLAANGAAAQQCYYYWASDCFEIRDAGSRDIVHHVLVSPEPQRFTASSDQCAAPTESLNVDAQHKALKRFNKVLGRIDGCKRLDNLTPKVFADSQTAHESYAKLSSQRSFKVVHPINRLPEL